MRLHYLQAIAERILDKEAAMALNLIIGARSVPGVSAAGSDHIEILYVKSDMGLLRGSKLRIDAEVQLCIAELKPSSAPCSKSGRLGYLAQAEDLTIEAARLVLESAGYRQLYVIDAQNGHV